MWSTFNFWLGARDLWSPPCAWPGADFRWHTLISWLSLRNMALFYRMARYPDLDLFWMIGSLLYVGALPFHDSLAWPGALKEYGSLALGGTLCPNGSLVSRGALFSDGCRFCRLARFAYMAVADCWWSPPCSWLAGIPWSSRPLRLRSQVLALWRNMAGRSRSLVPSVRMAGRSLSMVPWTILAFARIKWRSRNNWLDALHLWNSLPCWLSLQNPSAFDSSGSLAWPGALKELGFL
jgi:hypothetical protein